MWAPHHLEPRPRRRQAGGIAPCKGATRRRHAVRRLRMAQNPHRYQYRARCRGGRARLGRRWVAETRQLYTPSGATRNKSRPARAARPNFRYKTLPVHPLAPHVRDKTLPARPFSPHVRYKTLPARPPSPHFRYKTLPARPKWLDLALFRHAGRVLYRCHHQEAKQGEFCTERKAETRLANTRAHGPHLCGGCRRDRCGGCRRDRCGGHRRDRRARAGFEAQSLAAVPVGGGGARPQYPQTTATPRPDKFRT